MPYHLCKSVFLIPSCCLLVGTRILVPVIPVHPYSVMYISGPFSWVNDCTVNHCLSQTNIFNLKSGQWLNSLKSLQTPKAVVCPFSLPAVASQIDHISYHPMQIETINTSIASAVVLGRSVSIGHSAVLSARDHKIKAKWTALLGCRCFYLQVLYSSPWTSLTNRFQKYNQKDSCQLVTIHAVGRTVLVCLFVYDTVLCT
jgi:hypothetical protein